MKKFNNSELKIPILNEPVQTLPRCNTEQPARQSHPKKDPKEIAKGDEPSNKNGLSNKPNQSEEIIEEVLSVKERMRAITQKKELIKENNAAKEIKKTSIGSVKEKADILAGLGLLAPPKVMEKIIVEKPKEKIEEGLEKNKENEEKKVEQKYEDVR